MSARNAVCIGCEDLEKAGSQFYCGAWDEPLKGSYINLKPCQPCMANACQLARTIRILDAYEECDALSKSTNTSDDTYL